MFAVCVWKASSSVVRGSVCVCVSAKGRCKKEVIDGES